MRSSLNLNDEKLYKLAQRPLSESASGRVRKAIKHDRKLMAFIINKMEPIELPDESGKFNVS